MKVGLLIVLSLLAGALLASFLLPDNGYVLISFRGYVVETSVTVLALLFALMYAAVRVLLQVWRAPRRLGEAWAKARLRYAGRQATKGFIALAEGRFAQGERLLTRGARISETPLLNYLAAARAAQMQGDHARRDGWLQMACEQEPAATDAVLLTQAELQMEDGQYREALATLNRVRDRHPTHGQALKLLGEIYHRQKDWQPLAELLPTLRRKGNVPKDMLDEWSIDTYAAILASPGLDRAALDALWEDVPRNVRSAPRVIATRVHGLVAAGAADDAEELLRQALRDGWDPTLIGLYGELQVADVSAQLKRIEAWLKERPEDADLLLAAARACVRHQLWGKARSYLEASLAIRPTAATYQTLGQLMLRLGDGPAASKAFERGLTVSASPPKLGDGRSIRVVSGAS